jgi:hypothetical protein
MHHTFRGRSFLPAALISAAVMVTSLPLAASASDLAAWTTGTGYYGGNATVEFIRDGVRAASGLDVLAYYPPVLTSDPAIETDKARRPFKVRVTLKASHNAWMSPEASSAASCEVTVTLLKPNGKKKTIVVANPMEHGTTQPYEQTIKLSKWWRYKATDFTTQLVCRPHEVYGHY